MTTPDEKARGQRVSDVEQRYRMTDGSCGLWVRDKEKAGDFSIGAAVALLNQYDADLRDERAKNKELKSQIHTLVGMIEKITCAKIELEAEVGRLREAVEAHQAWLSVANTRDFTSDELDQLEDWQEFLRESSLGLDRKSFDGDTDICRALVKRALDGEE